MKKYDIIKNFLFGGCLGVTLMEISYFLVGFLVGTLNDNIIRLIKIFFIIFFFGGIIYILAVISIHSLKYKDMQSREKQRVLTRQIRLTSIMIIILSFAMLFYSIKSNSMGVILSLGFIIVFVLWGYGCFIEYATLKRNMAMVKKVE